NPPAPRLLDSAAIISDLQFLSSDLCEGRKPGTAGHEQALQRLATKLRSAAVDSFDNSLLQDFTTKAVNGTTKATNIVGFVKGTASPQKFIVITAHYDHLGIAADGKIFHGADDNASGAACLVAMATYFKQHPHNYSLIFAALDREESGLDGAYELVRKFNDPSANIKMVMNFNMDMIARSDKNEIFACGISYYPVFRQVVEETRRKTTVKLLMGHDTGGGIDDWTKQSDHYAFLRAGIPFLYIGVEDHPDYHKVTDTFDKVDKGKYIENCNMLLQMILLLKP
ncbi:MAG TPA: M28 family peptidase, partial [Flavitalea sp.]|nr:M28 family peptidase [Flavitalea sp.]